MGKDEQQTNGTQLHPDVFCLATGNAPLGRLYDDSKTKDRLKTPADMSEGRSRWAVDMSERPKFENASSETTTGIIWRIARQRIKECSRLDDDYEPKIGIGSLYSNILDNPEEYPPGPETSDPGINYQIENDTIWIKQTSILHNRLHEYNDL